MKNENALEIYTETGNDPSQLYIDATTKRFAKIELGEIGLAATKLYYIVYS